MHVGAVVEHLSLAFHPGMSFQLTRNFPNTDPQLALDASPAQ